MVNKLKKGYHVGIEDVIENIFITLALAFFFDGKVPSLRKAIIITIVTVFYWLIIYNFLRPFFEHL